MKRALVFVLILVATACATTRPGATALADGASTPDAGAPAAPPPWVHDAPPPSLPSMGRTEPRSFERTLGNGLTIVVVEHHARPLVSARLFFPSGAAADAPERTGVTYFTVSGLLGTHDRKHAGGDRIDPSEKSARRLVLELGATLAFEVTEDRASIGIDGFAVDLERYLSRLYEIVRAARHGEDTFAAEVGAVADRLDELEVSDSAVLEQFLGRLSFGEGHPYARPIYGTPESVTRLGLEDVIDRQSTLLVPKGSTLLVAGDVEAGDVFRVAERHFGPWRPSASQRRLALRAPAISPRKDVTLLPRKPAPTTMVCATRPLTDVIAPRSSFEVLARVLSTRMSEALREQRAFTYGVKASILELRRARALVACSRLDAKQTTPALGLFLSTLFDLASSPLTEREVEAARAMLVAENDASTDELAGIVRVFGHAIALDEPVSLRARSAELRAMTLASLQGLAKKLARRDLFQLVVSGEPAIVEQAVKAHKLGRTRTPRLSRTPVD